MKTYSLIKDSRLVRQFGSTFMDQVVRMLRTSDIIPAGHQNLSNSEVAILLFVIFTATTPTDAVRIAKSYEKLTCLNKNFSSKWKRFLFETKSQKEIVENIARIWFGDKGSFVIVHDKDETSQTFSVPGHKRASVQDVRIINDEFLFSILLELQQEEFGKIGKFIG